MAGRAAGTAAAVEDGPDPTCPSRLPVSRAATASTTASSVETRTRGPNDTRADRAGRSIGRA